MIVLGIDPGCKISGFAIMKKEAGNTFLLDYGALTMSSADTLVHRVGIFFAFFKEKIERWQVTDISLETSFLGKNAQTFLKLGYLRGALYVLVASYHLNLHEFAPREIKLALTGFGGAEKEQVARMVQRLFPRLVMTKRFDITDALAIALCGLWKNS